MKTLHYSIITITSIIFLICSSSPVFGSEQDWKSLHIVGKYLGSNPPKPDQTFIFNYASINGTVESLKDKNGSFEVKITASNPGLFEIKIPRNYPYTNSPYSSVNPNAFILQNDLEVGPQDYKFAATECYFEYSVPFSGNSIIDFVFTYIPETNSFPLHGDKVSYQCMQKTVYSTKIDSHDAPLQQLRNGILPDDVSCNESMTMVIKRKDGSPSCVMPESATKLVLSGWATNPLSYVNNHPSEFFNSNVTMYQQNQFFYDMLNLPRLKEWSETGWVFSKLSGFYLDSYRNIDRAYVEVYLPPNFGHPKAYCEYGWYAWLVVNRQTLQIENGTYPDPDSCTKQFQIHRAL